MSTAKKNQIVEFASNLAHLELIEKYNLLPDQLMNDNGEGYKDEYQDEFDNHYDNYYEQLSNL